MIPLNIRIVCDRPDFLVCIKPQGIESENPGLPSLLCRQENLPALYPVHRLDRGTGGLLLLAKSAASCRSLSEAFSSRSVQKQYLAVVQSDHICSSGVMNDLLYHDPKTNKSFVVRTMRKGVREASCEWELLGSVQADPVPLHLVKIRLHTGRTHQIRIQFASRRMPLYGDSRYGSRYKAANPSLWACGLSLPDPLKPESTLFFRADPPDTDPWTRFIPDERKNDPASDALPPQSGGFPLR